MKATRATCEREKEHSVQLYNTGYIAYRHNERLTRDTPQACVFKR